MYNHTSEIFLKLTVGQKISFFWIKGFCRSRLGKPSTHFFRDKSAHNYSVNVRPSMSWLTYALKWEMECSYVSMILCVTNHIQHPLQNFRKRVCIDTVVFHIFFSVVYMECCWRQTLITLTYGVLKNLLYRIFHVFIHGL